MELIPEECPGVKAAKPLIGAPGRIAVGVLVALWWALAALPAAGAVLDHVQTVVDGTGLDGARGLAVSPDGAHVYATSYEDDALLVFARDVVTGALTLMEAHRDGVDGVEGVDGPRSVIVSADGAHVYVTGWLSGSVAVFARDRATGALAFVEAQRRGVNGVEGLLGSSYPGLSPDGAHAYVCGYEDASLAVFARDAASGKLTFVEVQRSGLGGVEGLAGCVNPAVSPDGAYVYVAALGDLLGLGSALTVFARDAPSGKLTFLHAYGDGVLRGVHGVALSADGAYAYALGFYDNAVAVFARDGPTGALTLLQVLRTGENGVQGLDGAAWLALSPDGSQLYVVGYREDALVVFARDPATGLLTFDEVHRDGVNGVDGLEEAVVVDVSRDGTNVYVTSEADGALAVFARDPATGRLTFVEVRRDRFGAADGLDGVRSVAVSPDGAHVYTASAAATRTSTSSTSLAWPSVSVFARDAATGVLRFVEAQRTSRLGAYSGGAAEVAVSPDGTHVYAAAHEHFFGTVVYEVAVYGRDVATGKLTLTDVLPLPSTQSVAVSPDGAHVYVAEKAANAVAVFERDVASGRLTLVEEQRNGAGGVEGLVQPEKLRLSPDGGNVYVTSAAEAAVVVFAREPAAGRLTFVEVQRDAVGGVDGLSYARGLAVSPDGGHLYVCGDDQALDLPGDRAVAVFERGEATGALTFVEAQRDGLSGASSVAVGPDGAHVFVADPNRGAVAAFRRDRASGALAFLAAQGDGENGVNGLARAVDVAVSPDGAHLYVAGHGDRAVTVFAVSPSECAGDCNEDGHVTIEEVITLVDTALGGTRPSACPNGDRNGDGQITIDEIIRAVNHTLNGCPPTPAEQGPEMGITRER